jgi:RNA polymerase sigma factor (sigma-70 family)
MPLLTDAAFDAEVTAAIAGDRDAFARLVAATSSLVTAITLSETRDVELARDAAQDVYLQVWGGLGGLRQPGSFLPWLRTAARRQARRLTLQRIRRARGAEADEALEQAADAGPGPGERLLDAERAALVRSALEALPDEARETLILYYREGHSSAQVGRLLGLSDAAVQQRLSRARGKLREEVLARLGEALAATAPAAGFTAAVVALLAPRTAAAAGAQAAGGLLAALQVPKAAIAAAVALLAALGAFLVQRGPPGPGGGGPPVVTIARPAGERPPSEAPREMPRAEAPPATDGALEVQVTAAGRPVGGAALRVYAYVAAEAATGRSAWRLLAATATDAAGLSRVPAAPGAYLLVAAAAGLAPGQQTAVRPSGEPVTRVALALEPPVTLAGRTIGRDGQPVALAALSLTRLGEQGAPRVDPPDEVRSHGASDGRGAFRIEGLAPGRWQLTAEAAGHARTVVERLTLPRTAPLDVVLGAAAVIEGLVVTDEGRPAPGATVSFAGGAELLQVESGPSGGFAAEVTAGTFRISAVRGDEAGWVEQGVSVGPGATAPRLTIRLGVAARFTGKVVDGADRPVAGAQVLVTPYDGRGEVARLATTADGAFASPPLAPGDYDLDASAEGYAPAASKGLVLLPHQHFAVTLRLRATGEVSGTVRSEAGAPLAGIHVRGGLRWGDRFGQVDGEAVTDGQGRYRLTGLAPGVVSLSVRHLDSALGPGRNLELKAGQVATADFVLPALGRLEGRLRMADGSPLPEDVSAIVGPDRNSWSRSDTSMEPAGSDGRFQLALPAGRWRVRAWNARGTVSYPGQMVAEVRAGAAATVELALEAMKDQRGHVRVTVLEPGGAPSDGANVEVHSPPGAAVMTSTDASGRAEASLWTPQRSTEPLLVNARNGGRRAVRVAIPPEVKEATIQLLPAARLHGTLSAGGAPVTGFTLRVEYAPIPPLKYADREERRFTGDVFLLADAPPGEATLIVLTDDGRAGRATVTLRSGESSEVKVEVAPAGTLRVRLLNPSGQPEPDAYVMVGGKMIDASIDGLDYDPARVKDGALVAADLPPGPVELELGARCFEPQHRTVTIPSGQPLDLGDVTLKPLPPAACGR